MTYAHLIQPIECLSFFVLVAVYHAVIVADPENNNRSPEEVLQKYPPKLGITSELCAGIVDKSKPLIEIAKEEVLEECGYNVPIDRFELILSYRYDKSNSLNTNLNRIICHSAYVVECP